MDFLQICHALAAYPDVSSSFNHSDVIKYIELVGLLKAMPVLAYLSPSHIPSVAPSTLPANVHEFLRLCFDLSDETAKLAWECFRPIAWAFTATAEEQKAHRMKHVKVFLQYGLALELSIYSLCPPTRVCLDPACRQPLHSNHSVMRDRELSESKSHKITVFSLELGTIPGFSTSQYCRNCHTRYYPNYYVHSNATKRTYYLCDRIPEFIQCAEHFYSSHDLCELFANMMVTAWTSGTNCARIYNTSISKHELQPFLPQDWFSLHMDVDHIYNSFFLHALLLDHLERQVVLELAHNAPTQAERLRPALEARNTRMAGTGQEQWSHVCNLCCYIYQDAGEWFYLRSVITDGVTVGHWSCCVLDCQIPLRSVKDSFCAVHEELQNQCCITTCNVSAERGYRTCCDPEHREVELYHYQRGKAMFQLRDRLRRAKGFTPSAAFTEADSALDLSTPRLSGSQRETDATGADLLPSSGEDLNDDEEEVEYTCPSKSSAGNRILRARFGRRRTHNEELAVYSCGVVAGRATFFGSEAPNGVREFWMRLFPTKASVPGVLWHDNNCSVVKMLRNDVDPHLRHYFDHVALPVDVFHFKSKHKEGDVDCGANCNPYIWPELRTTDGKWRFNSSAAEQTNAWFGGYQSVVREMTVERYNFFLDEMIRRRNQILVGDLKKKGKLPDCIPREVLLA